MYPQLAYKSDSRTTSQLWHLAGWTALALLAWLIATQPLLPLAGAAVTAAGALLLLYKPWLTWVGLAFLLPVAAGERIGPASMADLLLAATLSLWFIEGARRRTLRLHLSPLLLPFAVYLTALAVSLWAASDLGEATVEVIKWLEFGAIVLTAPSALTGGRSLWLAVALLLAGVAQAILGLYQFVFRIGPEWFLLFDRFMRASGTFAQPNPFAAYLGLTLPVAVSLALWAWNQTFTRYRWRAAAWAIFYSGCAALIAAGLAASWSRGGWLGAAAGITLVLAARSRAAALATAVAVALGMATILLGLASPGLLPQPVAVRIQDIPSYLGLADVLSQPLTDENFAVVERVAHWVAAIRMWELAPWFGIGPGNYATIYPSVRLPLWEEPLGHAHNIYLNVLAENGIIGLLAFLLFWAAIVVWLVRSLGALPRNSWSRALACGVLGIIAGHLAVHSFFDNLFVQGMYLHLALWIAILLSIRQPQSPDHYSCNIVVKK